MLERLEIRNYVLIKNLVLDFSTGFAVITGETGSGKSIILGALSLILGEKARQDIVRQGEKEAQINALFSYSEGSAVDCYLKGNSFLLYALSDLFQQAGRLPDADALELALLVKDRKASLTVGRDGEAVA